MPFLSMIGRRYGRTDDVVAAPAPAPPGPGPGTQLLLNSGFTSFNVSTAAATNWTSTTGWQVHAYDSSRVVTFSPCTVTNMPIRDVYPTSSSTGFIIFSYVTATVSQTVSIASLSGINTITGVLNIVNVSNGSPDTFTFQIQYKNSAGTVIYTTTTGSTTAPASWTEYTLVLLRSASPNFDLIKSITVNITAKDNGNWGGQYGPAMDYCTLTLT